MQPRDGRKTFEPVLKAIDGHPMKYSPRSGGPPAGTVYFENLDSIRGICAILVALFHTAWASHVHLVPLVANGWLFVDFFFVLSGFVITHNYAGKLLDIATTQAFLIRRFFRLYPLHLATLLLTMLLTVFGRSMGSPELFKRAMHDISSSVQTVDFTAALFLLHGLGFSSPTFNTASWSISTEFWTYFVFAAVALLAGSSRKIAAVMALLGLVSFATLFWLNYPKGLFTAYQYGFLRCLAGFSSGSLVWYAWSKKAWQPPPIAIVLLYAVLCLAMWLMLAVATLDTYSNIALLPVFAGVVYVNAVDGGSPIKRFLESPPLRFVGRRSYSIYMVHTAVLIIVSACVSAFAPDLKGGSGLPMRPLLAGDAFCVAYLALILLVASAAYRFIELPSQHMGKRFALKASPA